MPSSSEAGASRPIIGILLAILAGAIVPARQAGAADYPTRTVQVIVPFTAGAVAPPTAYFERGRSQANTIGAAVAIASASQTQH